MDISSGQSALADVLSNFTPRSFVFDGVQCHSMEGFLQALKFDDVEKQIAVCARIGIKAKNWGRKRNAAWKIAQTLWWQGASFARDGAAFQKLLDHAFDALATNEGFRQALLATGLEELTHSMGNSNICDTVLTEEEFCSRLMGIRSRLSNEIL